MKQCIKNLYILYKNTKIYKNQDKNTEIIE